MPSIIAVAVGSFVGLWVSMTILSSPMFASTNCRRLLAGGPSEYSLLNYLGGMGVFTFGHVALIFAGSLLNFVVEVDTGVWFLVVTLLYPVSAWGVASVLLPRFGWWEPNAAGLDGRLVLGFIALWYTVWSVILAALFAFVWFLAFYPG